MPLAQRPITSYHGNGHDALNISPTSVAPARSTFEMIFADALLVFLFEYYLRQPLHDYALLIDLIPCTAPCPSAAAYSAHKGMLDVSPYTY